MDKLIDKGWDIKISREPRRINGIDEIRIVWEARRLKKGRAYYDDEAYIEKESKWNGFRTSKEAIADLHSKLK